MSTDQRLPSAPSSSAGFRSPLLPGVASLVLLLAAALFGLSAISGSEATQGMWVLSAVFLVPAVALGRAGMRSRRSKTSSDEMSDQGVDVAMPTVHGMYPILVSLISVYCWILVIGMQVFAAFNGGIADNTKWYITLGIAIAAWLFMQFHGNAVLQRNCAGTSPRAANLTAAQSIGVVAFVIGAGAYLSWIVFW
jgi:hypothetical protein